MSKALIEKLRRAREVKVSVGGKTFTVRRPNDVDAIAWQEAGGGFAMAAERFVVGWDLCEVDIIPGGGPDPVPFDVELWAEFVADRHDLWRPLAIAALDGYKKHEEEVTQQAKN